jgi:hypothetical protein
VPVDRRAEAAAELGPVLALLSDTEQECARLGEEARLAAEQAREQAREQAAALVAAAREQAPGIRAAAASRARASADAEADRVVAASERQAAAPASWPPGRSDLRPARAGSADATGSLLRLG